MKTVKEIDFSVEIIFNYNNSIVSFRISVYSQELIKIKCSLIAQSPCYRYYYFSGHVFSPAVVWISLNKTMYVMLK